MTDASALRLPGLSPEVQLGDGIEGLAALPPGSVDLLLSDLPSGETKAAFDRKPDLQALWSAAEVALCPDGVAVLMASSLRFAAELIDSNQEGFRYDLIWAKSVATGFLNASHRPLRSHEFVLVFYPRGRGFFSPQMEEGHSPIKPATRTSGHGANYSGQSSVQSSREGATDRHPRSVLTISSVGTSSRTQTHPAEAGRTHAVAGPHLLPCRWFRCRPVRGLG